MHAEWHVAWHVAWCVASVCVQHMLQLGARPETTKNLKHIFVAVIFFPPLFCANTFDTSLLLIVCALK